MYTKFIRSVRYCLIGMYFLMLLSVIHAQNVVSIEIKSSKPDTAQLFYDIGKGLSEANSAKVKLKGNSDFERIEFAIPAGNLKALRLDPLQKPGFLEIRKASLKSADKAIPIPLEQFVPANHIALNKIQDGVLYLETTPDATDPQVLLKVFNPAVQALVKQQQHINTWLVHGVALFFCIIFSFIIVRCLQSFTSTKSHTVSENPRHINSFDIIRFIAAAAVIIGHHYALNGDAEPPIPLVKDTLPGLAVCVFFSISGYLIFNSLQRDCRAAPFFAARFARILPNLFFSLVIVSLVMMIWFGNYRNLEAHLRYIWNNIWMFSHGVQFTIPGVLEGRPLPGPNGSLWTLPYEFWMYVALFVIFLLRESLRRPVLLLAFILCSLQWITATPGSTVKFLSLVMNGASLGKLGTYFFAGGMVAAFWPVIVGRKLSLSVGLGGCGVASAVVFGPANPALAACITLLSILLGLGAWGAWFNKGGDPSYGMYIFGFPVSQLALLACHDFYISLAFALVITIGIGYATYWAFERRCISARGVLAPILRLPFRSCPENLNK